MSKTENNIKKVVNAFEKYQNPLRGLTTLQIDQMMQNAKHGNDIRLQTAFYEIERQTPIFQVCIQKRIAGVQNRHWDIITLDDSSEAKAQQQKLKAVFAKADTLNDDGLSEAISHLVLAQFRGRSAVKPFFDENGDMFFKKLNNWNFNEFNGKLYWNPEADFVYNTVEDGLARGKVVELPKDEICYLLDDRPVDLPGLMIYLRQLVGETQWARFIEKCGMPQVCLTVPDGTSDDQLAKWSMRAQAIFEGASGCLPANSKIDILDSARGQDPFTSFIEHQMELIAIISLGSSLATIGGSTGLGSNLAEVQNDQLISLINRDCKRIANTITSCAVKKCIDRYFPGQQMKVRFSFVENDQIKPEEYIGMAERVKALGLSIDVQKLKELTHLEFISDEQKDIWTPVSETKENEDEIK